MSNGLYALGRQKFLEGEIAWLTDDIKAVIIDTADYTVNLATHEFLDDVPAGARVATSPAFSGKTSTNGVADATDVTFSAVEGDEAEALIIYQDTGSEATSALIAYIDSAIGLPIVPNGGDAVVVFDSAANKIFKL